MQLSEENGSFYTTLTHWLPSHAVLNKAILACRPNCTIKSIENNFNALFAEFNRDRIKE